MMDVFDLLPLEWHCIRCKREFPFEPDGEMPCAFATQRKNDICRECYEAKA